MHERQEVLVLPPPLRARLWGHARSEAPRECVGLLGGREQAAATLYPLNNVAPRPEREYRADALEVLRALKAMRREGLELLGIYHSHPAGPSWPSETDVNLARYAVPYLIVDLQGATLRAFRLPEKREVRLG
ncbi:Mov34/MPN/PAD-1 family protein [Deinococcus peraridilitoris]|uniref:Putative metal-dependent protease of the PAD1/JAB1 superfamily n=1 Tax=Deinococcus peraridilitoris (strain DSM 19664 / LMG 22246 / CIP 109416 / KR-200) TaxID=937777 RepID=K9ZZF9_DEIPD|nr:M67 family metallopeptidase [Deinococcus peraridilitoris]AFZ66120.1 putative metal-dependent protease of the PAD1/JAB1 superfamily [Deinococcus peraridilitoris DSM 19664]